MDSLIIITAKYALFLSIAVAAFVWLRLPGRQKLEGAIWVALGGAVALALVKLAGALFFDSRPFVIDHIAPLFPHAADNGFPSDHTVVAMLLAVCVLFYARRWGVALAVIALVLGASRVAAHVHTPIDILGGIVIAVAAALVTRPAACWLTRRLASERSAPQAFGED